MSPTGINRPCRSRHKQATAKPTGSCVGEEVSQSTRAYFDAGSIVDLGGLGTRIARTSLATDNSVGRVPLRFPGFGRTVESLRRSSGASRETDDSVKSAGSGDSPSDWVSRSRIGHLPTHGRIRPKDFVQRDYRKTVSPACDRQQRVDSCRSNQTAYTCPGS